MIDTHVHLGQLRFDDPGMSPSTMLRWMDRHGIEKAVVMAVEVPEELDYFVTTRELLRITRRHRDRLLPLCAADPRHRYPGSFDPYPILKAYIEDGCVGYGENLCGLPVDDPIQQRVYEACDRLKIPIVMHIDWWINRDKLGLPGFEQMVATFKQVKNGWVTRSTSGGRSARRCRERPATQKDPSFRVADSTCCSRNTRTSMPIFQPDRVTMRSRATPNSASLSSSDGSIA